MKKVLASFRSEDVHVDMSDVQDAWGEYEAACERQRRELTAEGMGIRPLRRLARWWLTSPRVDRVRRWSGAPPPPTLGPHMSKSAAQVRTWPPESQRSQRIRGQVPPRHGTRGEG
jgi:hypothetical protein